jgi:hypothetical protein
MNVQSLVKRVWHEMKVDGETYKRDRYGWFRTISYDIHAEDENVEEDLAIELEKAFQEYKNLI